MYWVLTIYNHSGWTEGSVRDLVLAMNMWAAGAAPSHIPKHSQVAQFLSSRPSAAVKAGGSLTKLSKLNCSPKVKGLCTTGKIVIVHIHIIPLQQAWTLHRRRNIWLNVTNRRYSTWRSQTDGDRGIIKMNVIYLPLFNQALRPQISFATWRQRQPA